MLDKLYKYNPALEENQIRVETQIRGANIGQWIESGNPVFNNADMHIRTLVDTQEKHFADALKQIGWTPPDDHSTRHKVNGLRCEISCRIEHGAESNGHLTYVLGKLDEILEGMPS